MARDPRFIDNESGLVEIMTRTIQGRYLMRPSPMLNAIILGILARGQHLYDVPLYAFIFLSNHYHLLAAFRSVLQMSAFCCYVNGNIAREVGKLVGWREKFWGSRYHHAPLADNEEAQFRRLKYIFSNSCKENLVSSPLEWPGVSAAHALVRGQYELEGTWFDRTKEYRAKRSGKIEVVASLETVNLSPLPAIEGRSAAGRQQFYNDVVREVEAATKQQHQRESTRPLGVRAILRQDPHARPKAFVPSPAPKFHATTREGYRKLHETRGLKVLAYREAATRLQRGELDVRFPEGCFPPRLPFVQSRAPT